VHEGRKVLELRPPVPISKANAVRRLLEGVDVDTAMYAGDDRTDVDAFDGLRELVDEGRLRSVLCVGVRSPESPPEILKAADVLVPAGDGVRSLLRALTDG
jgi:trehalose 6-phosphate phosphatase